MTPTPTRRTFALAALCASLLGPALPALAEARRARHGRSHHHVVHRRAGRSIPQHNGGDHDSDNNGGPSDGDGGI
jgi:hypothetical protein